jgi:uncharacterized membrane protein YecN with MAPEG domain
MRRQSLLGSVIGVLLAVVGWAWLTRSLAFGGSLGAAERIGLAAAALLPTIIVLDLMIVVQMGRRAWTRAVDPLAGRDDRLLQVNQRALTNTVEQLVGFAPALLALAAGASPDWMHFVVAAGVVFGVARLVFWVGYLLGPMLRAPGMAASYAINVATLAAAIWVWWP